MTEDKQSWSYVDMLFWNTPDLELLSFRVPEYEIVKLNGRAPDDFRSDTDKALLVTVSGWLEDPVTRLLFGELHSVIYLSRGSGTGHAFTLTSEILKENTLA